MAKISHDDDSWHAGGVIVRDKRQVKDPADERPVGKAPARKKNTKKWCKGKEGREHQIVWVKYWSIHGNHGHSYGEHWLVERCKVCHKTFAYCYGYLNPKAKCQKHGVKHVVAE